MKKSNHNICIPIVLVVLAAGILTLEDSRACGACREIMPPPEIVEVEPIAGENTDPGVVAEIAKGFAQLRREVVLQKDRFLALVDLVLGGKST